jgi:T1SS-143 domain-containing protein
MAIIQIGFIESLDGQVSVMHTDGSTELLQAGSAIYAGDTVITAEDATAGIRFLDGSVYSLGPDFTARLDSGIFDPAGLTGSAQQLSADGDAAGFVALSNAGVVTALAGDVEVIHADGGIETLHTGDFVYTDDVIKTSADGSADLKLLDGSLRHVDPGSMASLGDGVPAPGFETPATLASARADAAGIVQSILEGEDPTETAEAPAAGEAVQEDSGTSVVRLEESGRRVTPESGHETTGIGYGFADVNEELLQTPVNRAPEPHDTTTTGADDDALSTRENVPLTIDTALLLANDADPDGDPLTLVSVGKAANGTVELLGDQVLFTPDPGFYGTASFQYTVTDGSLTASATVTVDVDSIPDAGNGMSAVDESAMSPAVSTGAQTVSADFGDDGPGEINGNGSFTASSMLTSAGQPVAVSVDAGGNYSGTIDAGSTTVFTLVFDPAGSGYLFTLEQPLDHPDSSDPNDAISLDFGYTATDGNDDTAEGNITIVVNDDGPSITDAGTNTPEDTAITFNVFDHATAGADGAILKDVSLAVADDGTIPIFDEAGNVTYAPSPGFDGVAIINFTIEDGDGDQASGQFSVSVGADSIPTIVADSGTVDESALTTGSGGGVDTASGQLVFDTGEDVPGVLQVQDKAGNFIEIAADGTHVEGVYGDLSVNRDGSWSYTLGGSTTDHAGVDQTGTADQVQDSFLAQIVDSDNDVASDTLIIAITDDGPVASADGTVDVNEGASTAGNLLANDTQGADGAMLTHVNGNELVFDAVSGEATVVTALGTLVVEADGSYTYMASDNSNGTDVFSYTLTDADGDTSQSTVSFALQDANTPTANDSNATVDEAALTGGSDAGSPNESTSGVLNFSPGGDRPFTLEVNGTSVSSTGTTVITGSYGDLVIDIDGNWSYTLGGSTTDHTGVDQTGTADQVQDVFSFMVRDHDSDSASGSLTINVTDDGPVASADATTTAEDAAVTYNVLADDVPGADGVTLVAASLNSGAGVVSFEPGGDITFTPAAGFEGTAVIDYTVEDADGDQAGAQLTVEVAADSQPSVLDDSGTVDESALADGSGGGTHTTGGALSISTGGDTLAGLTVNGEAVAATGTTLITGVYGNLGVDIDGNWSYTLSDSTTDHSGVNQTGAADQVQESFSILVTDSDGDTAGSTLTINVTDDGPAVATARAINVEEGATSASASLASLVSEAGADGASVTAVNGSDLTGAGTVTVAGAHGTLVVDLDNGTFEYRASDNDAGTDVFTFTVTDGDLDMDSVDYSYTVVDANEPVAGDLFRTVDEAALVTGSDSASDKESTSGNLADLGVSFNGDISGSLTVGEQSILLDGNGDDSITVSGTYGDWLIHDDGSWTYTLNGNTTAHSSQGTGADDVEDVFSYTVTDSDGDQASGSLTVSVQDDVPTAIVDPATVELRDGDTSASGTLAALIAVAGADGASVTAVNGMDLAGAGIVVVDGDNGSLVVNLDNGTYTYTASTEDTGSDNFVFTITDGDGDTDTVAVSYEVSDRPNLATDSYVWLPVDQAQQAPGYEAGYPIGLEVSDLDSTLTVTISEVPDDGQAGYYDGSNAFVPLNAGDTFVLAVGELMPQIVYIPPDVDMEAVVDPITDIVSFTVTEDGDPLTTQSGTININAMPPYDLPGEEAVIGDGNTPLTSGNDQSSELLLSNNLITAITRDIGDDGAINNNFIELYTDFQERPSSGGVPIPESHRADAELESTVSARISIDGVEFIVVAENDAVNQWAYDSESGLMKAVVNYNDVSSADAQTFDGSLADYLVANPPEVGDAWTVIYQDSGSGNEQARYLKFDFAYDNPGDPAISVISGADAPNIIYGSSGEDILTGGGVEDEIHGRGGDDVLIGADGSDILIGGTGEDHMTGDAGADRFVIRSADEGVDSIMDYSSNESDVLDISDILTGFDPESDTLSDFVSITSDGTDATVAVDPTGGGAYTDIALLSNITSGALVTIQVADDTMETLIVA